MTDAEPSPPASDAGQPVAGDWLSRLKARIDHWLTLHVERHTVAAFIMVTISVLGAVAAYRVGLAEQRSIVLERRLAHGQLQDIGFRQQLLAEVLVRIGLNDVENRLRTDAAELRRAYKSLSAKNRGAAWLEWRATEMVLQRNAILRFSTFLRTFEDPKATVESELAKRSADELRAQGFLAVPDTSANPRAGVMFPSLHEAIVKAHEISASLALCVLLFVLGLVFLTLAELGLGPPWVWAALAASGVAVGLIATGAVLAADPASGWTLGPLTIVFAVACVLSLRFDLFQVPRDQAHTPHPEAPEPARVSFAHMTGRSSHDGWSRSIILFITTAVFVSAVFGWFYSVSLKHAGHFALEAQQKKTELVNQRGRLGAVAMGGIFDAAIDMLTLRIRCTSATQLAALADEEMIAVDFDSAEEERKARCGDLDKRVKDRAFFVSMIDNGNLADSTANPARRLLDELMDRDGGPENTLALSEGYAEISVGWTQRAALLLAALTILAIALYLFGQAYTMGQTVAGRWLIRSGATVLSVSVFLGAYAWLRPVVNIPNELPASCSVAAAPPAEDAHAPTDAKAAEHGGEDHEPPDEATRFAELAAAKYAEGVRLHNVASTAPLGSREEFDAETEAAKALKCAIAARPGFIAAYQVLGRVVSLIQSPQRGDGGYISLYSRANLAELSALRRRELQAFVDAGMLRPIDRLGSYAFATTMLAFNGDPAALEEARTALDVVTGASSWGRRLQVEWTRPELVSEEPPSTNAVDRLNLALLQLATGKSDQIALAEKAYDEVLKTPADWSPNLMASALTDIEVLRTYCIRLHPSGPACTQINEAAARVRPLIANGVPAAGVPKSSAAASGFAVSGTPYSLSWRARLERFNPKSDRLTVAWYRDETREPDEPGNGFAWQMKRTLPAFFEMYYPDGTQLPDAGEDGTTGQEVLSLSKTGACLQSGRYFAELYLNGRLIASQPVRLAPHNLQVFRSRELDLNWCVPKDWLPWHGSRTNHTWFPDKPVRGFVSPHGKSGGMPDGAIMTFFSPATMTSDMRKAYFLRRAFQILLTKGETVVGTPALQWSQALEDRLLREAVPLESLSPTDCMSQAALNKVAYRFFTDRSEKNLIHIGIVGGPNVSGAETCAMLRSLGNHF